MNEAGRVTILEDVAINLRRCERLLKSVGHERLARICNGIADRLQVKIDDYDFEEPPPSAEIIIFSPRDSNV